MSAANKPVALIILDGWGYSEETKGNALLAANLPNYRRLRANYPNTLLKASGEAVGLPQGQMGNSEVGHLNIGAGRIVYQELSRIYKAIEDGELFKNQVLLKAMDQAKSGNRALHLMGLLSDGGVHSHIQHLIALLQLAKERGLSKVFLHVFLDGRDVLPDNAKIYIEQIEAKCKELGVGKIASVMGRYYAMDRDRRWDRVKLAYDAMTSGTGVMAATASAAVEQSYNQKVTDEFVVPTVLLDGPAPTGLVEDGDSIVFFNFRADRAREITHAFVDDDFTGFERAKHPQVHFVCLTQYDAAIDAPVAFLPQNLADTLGQVLAANKLKQLRIAETEKYAHVTFFFNGGVEKPNPGEDRELIPSPKVATYNLKPEMSAPEVTSKVVEKITAGDYDVIILNFANPDMVGHTGVFEATVKAVETVDDCLGKIVDTVLAQGGVLLITADHGNAEAKIDPKTNAVLTAHTTNQVPFILVGERFKGRGLRPGGSLRDIAPTLLDILGINQPAVMTGTSLLQV
ncbi:MAG TPA: 2,3-bisphosphoglycerate-independent phosphoglycerate mutase [Desulfobacteria bacterium]|nr:2,3-bisphosphoglycerate-independent phosphoglycerate mutase [Desulfobacteria bacterium]